MRKFLFAAVTLGAMAMAPSAMAQNASPKIPGNGTPAGDDKTNSSAT